MQDELNRFPYYVTLQLKQRKCTKGWNRKLKIEYRVTYCYKGGIQIYQFYNFIIRVYIKRLVKILSKWSYKGLPNINVKKRSVKLTAHVIMVVCIERFGVYIYIKEELLN